MAERLTDTSQTTIYPDKSIKHIAQARKYRQLSLDVDQYSAVSFRKYGKRSDPPRGGVMYANVWRETDKPGGGVLREQLCDKCTDIELDKDGANARLLLPAEWLSEPCILEVEWNWQQGQTPRTMRKHSMWYSAMYCMEEYASLTDSEQDLCNAILNRFSLLRDNHYGNSMPNLAEDIQTRFSLEDVAMEMQIACQRINGSVIQHTDYVVGDANGTHFPVEFYNLLMVSTMVGLIRKFVYGYLETPDIQGNAGVAYADRRQYYNKWKDELRDLQSDEKNLLDTFNRMHINFTGAATLVGGGVYGGGAKGGGILSNSMMAAVQKGWMNSFYWPMATQAQQIN